MTATNDLNNSAVLEAVSEVLRTELRLGPEPISADDRLDLLPNADSVRLMRAVSNLERRLGVEMDDDAIREAQTVAELVELLQSALAEQVGDR